jgi:hypothetical protein
MDSSDEDHHDGYTGCDYGELDGSGGENEGEGITHCCMRCGGVIATDTMYVDDAGFPVATSAVSKQARLEDEKRKAEASRKHREDNKTRSELAQKREAAKKKELKDAAEKQADAWTTYEDKYNAKMKKKEAEYNARLKAQGQILTDVEDKLKNARKAAAAAKGKLASGLASLGFGKGKKKK